MVRYALYGRTAESVTGWFYPVYLTEQEAQEAGDGTAEAQEFVDEGVFYWAGGVARVEASGLDPVQGQYDELWNQPPAANEQPDYPGPYYVYGTQVGTRTDKLFWYPLFIDEDAAKAAGNGQSEPIQFLDDDLFNIPFWFPVGVSVTKGVTVQPIDTSLTPFNTVNFNNSVDSTDPFQNAFDNPNDYKGPYYMFAVPSTMESTELQYYWPVYTEEAAAQQAGPGDAIPVSFKLPEHIASRSFWYPGGVQLVQGVNFTPSDFNILPYDVIHPFVEGVDGELIFDEILKTVLDGSKSYSPAAIASHLSTVMSDETRTVSWVIDGFRFRITASHDLVLWPDAPRYTNQTPDADVWDYAEETFWKILGFDLTKGPVVIYANEPYETPFNFDFSGAPYVNMELRINKTLVGSMYELDPEGTQIGPFFSRIQIADNPIEVPPGYVLEGVHEFSSPVTISSIEQTVFQPMVGFRNREYKLNGREYRTDYLIHTALTER